MKKKLLILSIGFLFSLTGIAQTKNVDVDNYYFNCAYRAIPITPLDPLFYYYSVIIKPTASARKNILVSEIADAVFVEGERRADVSTNADLTIELNIGNIVVKSSTVKERTESVKNKDGSVSTQYYYSVGVVYTFESNFVIETQDEVLKKSGIFFPEGNLQYNTDEYKTRKEAADFWNNNREVLIADLYRKHSLESADKVSSFASDNYGFPVVRGKDIIKTIDEKKHDENEIFRKATETLKSLLEAMTPNVPMDKERAEGLIEYFKSIPAKYTDPKSKADKNLRYAAYYNLCKIYIYLEEPDKVGEYADLILSNGQDTKDCERMQKAAEEVRKALNKTIVKTRHFSPDQYYPEIEE
ncbi:MAG: hypothetical protein LBU22_02780 [Dysgonamonadaceae bacterium]|jgi:hypothetical protein|nr:hypothetical protein [Dysgonamonadaceae bacterium]